MPDVPQRLTPGVSATLATFQTAAALQRHQEWVSQPAEEIPALLEAAGFTLAAPVIEAHEDATQAYVARRAGQTVVAFRGSHGADLDETLLNTLTDAKVRRVRPRALFRGKPLRGVRVHEGFYKDYLQIRDLVWQAVEEYPEDELYCTGFSLGSALANLCALDLVMTDKRPVTYHGMGTPRVGNAGYKQLFNRRVCQALRVIFSEDPVPRVPLFLGPRLGFMHVAQLLECDAAGHPVPADQINGRVRTAAEHLDDHDRDRYRDMIAGFLEMFQEDPGVLTQADGARPLWDAAKAEQASLRRLGR